MKIKLKFFLIITLDCVFISFNMFAETSATVNILTPNFNAIIVQPQQIATTINIYRSTVNWTSPVVAGLTSMFGWRNVYGGSSNHIGVDYGVQNDTEVRAAFDGIAYVPRRQYPGYGFVVIIDHGNGVFSIYAHLRRDERIAGQVIAEQVIGRSDSSGNATRPDYNGGPAIEHPHLHFGIWDTGNVPGITWDTIWQRSIGEQYAVNPGDYLDPEHADSYVSTQGSFSRIDIKTFIDSVYLENSIQLIPQGQIRNINYQTIWDLINSNIRGIAGSKLITVEVFDLGTAIGYANVSVKVEPPTIGTERPTGEIIDKRPTISAQITSPSNIPIGEAVMYLDGTEVAHYYTLPDRPTSINIEYTPNYDLNEGNHIVKITAKDILDNQSVPKEWLFNISVQIITHPWPMFRHDAKHTGQSEYNGPMTPNVKWSFSAGDFFRYSSPAVGFDETIYIGSFYGNIYAIKNGILKWIYPVAVPGNIESSPAISRNNTVYIIAPYDYGSEIDFFIYALYAIDGYTGKSKWIYPLDGEGWGTRNSPTIGTDDEIYVGDLNGVLHVLKPDGSLKWRKDGVCGNPPAIGSDGTIYTSIGNSLYALQPDSTVKWNLQLEGSLGIPVIGHDNNIYLPGYGTSPEGFSSLYSINPSGSLRWAIRYLWVTSNLGIGPDGTIYFGSREYLRACDSSGRFIWNYYDPGWSGVNADPAIGANNIVYIKLNDTNIYTISGSNANLVWKYDVGGNIYSSPAIGATGNLYVASYNNGSINAFGNPIALSSNSTERRVYSIIKKFAPSALFCLSGVYSFPNPAKQTNPTIHIECGIADKVKINIYNISGDLLHSEDISDRLNVVNGNYAYEYTWDISKIPSGVYIYSVSAEKLKENPIKILNKLSVIK